MVSLGWRVPEAECNSALRDKSDSRRGLSADSKRCAFSQGQGAGSALLVKCIQAMLHSQGADLARKKSPARLEAFVKLVSRRPLVSV
jgi:hypothetical protein